MDKSIYDTDYSKLTYGRGYVYSLQYHIVWCTKYRRDVLQDGVDVKLKAYLNKLAAEHQFTILAMEVMPDHVHLLGGHLWNPSYCIVTVSERSREMVEAYIRSQKKR